MSTHLQAKIIKQKLAQAKEAREQRRGNLEAQQYFLIEQVARHTDLKEKEVEEFIIDSQNYCDLLDKFLDKEGPKAVVFSYQLTDPPGPGQFNNSLLLKRYTFCVRIYFSSNVLMFFPYRIWTSTSCWSSKEGENYATFGFRW